MNREIRNALLAAALIMGAALGMNMLVDYGYIEREVSKQAMQVGIGLYLLVMGNSLPKKISSMSDQNCGSAKGQSLRRFAGWTFVLSGLAYSIIWLVLPADIATIAGISVVASGLILVVTPCVWLALRRKRSQQPAKP